MKIEEENLIKAVQKIKTPKMDSEFEDALGEILREKSQKMYEKKSQGGSFFLSWQMGLAFMSFVFLLTSTFLIINSSETQDKIKEYLQNEAKSALSKEAIVEVDFDDIDEIEVFVFDLMQTDSPALDVEIVKNKNKFEIYLYPGLYKLIFIKENKPPIEKELHVKSSDQNQTILLDIKFEESLDEQISKDL